jgi:hypothetical protein
VRFEERELFPLIERLLGDLLASVELTAEHDPPLEGRGPVWALSLTSASGPKMKFSQRLSEAKLGTAPSSITTVRPTFPSGTRSGVICLCQYDAWAVLGGAHAAGCGVIKHA